MQAAVGVGTLAVGFAESVVGLHITLRAAAAVGTSAVRLAEVAEGLPVSVWLTACGYEGGGER